MILPEQLTDEGIAEFELSIEGRKPHTVMGILGAYVVRAFRKIDDPYERLALLDNWLATTREFVEFEEYDDPVALRGLIVGKASQGSGRGRRLRRPE
jgi:hypothetical protein